MDGWLKQSTAIDLRIGPFLDETNGKDAETGLTVTQAEIRLSKAGGDFAQKNEATSLVHDELGYYICKLNATDTATLGMLKLAVHEAGALPVWHDWMVLPENVWDSLFGADKLQVHAVEITAGLITATALGADCITNAKIADDAIAVENIKDAAITAAKLAGDCITSAKIADNALANEHFAAGALTATEITGAAGCAVSSMGNNVITAASINADAITEAKIADNAIAAEHIAAGAIDNATFAADVGSTAYATNIIALAVRKALDEINIDHLMKVAVVDRDSMDEVVDGTVLANIMTKTDGDTSDFDPDTDSLEAIRDNMAGADAAAIADAVWDETRADHITQGSFGALGMDITLEGTANVADTTVQITLTGGVATNNYYNGQIVIITSGTGAGQARTIGKYLAAGTVATPTRDFIVAPDNTSKFKVVAADIAGLLEAGVAQEGGVATITLDATASGTNSIYVNNFVMITGGTGAGQTRLIGAYVGATKVCTIVPNWTTNPDATSIYQILPMARVDVAGWLGNLVTGDGDWAALKTDTAAILVDTAEIGAAGAGLTAITDDTSQIGAAGVGLTEAGGDGDHLVEAGGDGDHLTAINLPNQTMDITGNITGSLSGSVGSVAGNVDGDVSGNVDGTVAGVTPEAAGVAPTAAEIKTAIEAGGSHLALIKAVTDALTAAAATKLALSAGTIVAGTVSWDNTNASTTVFYSDDITEATADHFNGRVCIFTSGALQYQATSISDYELAAGEGKFTVVALTEAPADNVTFIII